MQNQCPHCGADNPPGKMLCGSCGKAVMAPKQGVINQGTQAQPQTPPQQPPTTAPGRPVAQPAAQVTAAPRTSAPAFVVPAQAPQSPATNPQGSAPQPPVQPAYTPPASLAPPRYAAPNGGSTSPAAQPPGPVAHGVRAPVAGGAPTHATAANSAASVMPVAAPSSAASLKAAPAAVASMPQPGTTSSAPTSGPTAVLGTGAPSVAPGASWISRHRGLAIGRATWLGGIAGGLGGLIPELILSQFWGLVSSNLLYDFLVFCTAGLLIGATLGAVDGLMARHLTLAIAGMRRGAIIGLVGGLITLVAAEIIFAYLGATNFARNVGWIVFGAPFGAIQGFRRRSSTQGLLGMVGGALGGLLGGFLTNFAVPFGIAIMGFLIGFFSGLLHDIFKRAWLKVRSGRSEGREVVLDRRSTVLGSGDIGQVDFGLYGDPSVSQRHIEIRKTGGAFQLSPIGNAPVLVNSAPVQQAVSLRDGDTIQLGNTQLVFQSRSAK